MVQNSNQNSEVGSACGTCSCERNYVRGSWYKYQEGIVHLFTHTFFRFSLKEMSCVYVDWVQPVQDKDQ